MANLRYYPVVDTETNKILQFYQKIDILKNIFRKIYIDKGKRLENDAEHSWHLAMMVWLFAGNFEKKINLEKSIKMALMHDLVEIYAGDTFSFDIKRRKRKTKKENKAAQKLFAILPDKLKKELHLLWQEYEKIQTPEAKFVQAMDKIQPIIQNIMVEGKAWKEFKITEKMVREYKTHYNEGSEFLMSFFNYLLKKAKPLLDRG